MTLPEEEESSILEGKKTADLNVFKQ